MKTCPQNPNAQKPIAVKPYKVHLTYCHIILLSKFQEISPFVVLVDTACAKSVVGKPWATRYIQMVESTFDVKVIAIYEKAPFKFGPGGRIFSVYALVVVFECADQRSRVAVKISVIDRDLPCLLSKSVIRGLRGVFDTDLMKPFCGLSDTQCTFQCSMFLVGT